jgi:hypothetical protein
MGDKLLQKNYSNDFLDKTRRPREPPSEGKEDGAD